MTVITRELYITISDEEWETILVMGEHDSSYNLFSVWFDLQHPYIDGLIKTRNPFLFEVAVAARSIIEQAAAELQEQPLARLRPAPLSPTEKQTIALGDRDGWFCHYCGIPLVRPRAKWPSTFPQTSFGGRIKSLGPSFATRDHIIPQSKGGTHHLSNLLLACGDCNAWKQATPYERFLTIFQVWKEQHGWEAQLAIILQEYPNWTGGEA